MGEKIVEHSILVYLKNRGHVAWKNENQGTYDSEKKTYRANKNPFKPKGVPDIIGISRSGRFIAIEVKEPSKHVRIKRNLEKWIDKERRGQKYGDEIKRFLDQYHFLKNIRNMGGISGFASELGDIQDMGL